jgi:hypothetical protein
MDQPIKQKRFPIWAIILIIVACFGGGVLFKIMKDKTISEPQPTREHLTISKDMENYFEKSIDENIISVSSKYCYFNEDYWEALDRETRKNYTVFMGIYLTNREGDDLYWCEIYGMYTKKKLAKWSKASGYKEFE